MPFRFYHQLDFFYRCKICIVFLVLQEFLSSFHLSFIQIFSLVCIPSYIFSNSLRDIVCGSNMILLSLLHSVSKYFLNSHAVSVGVSLYLSQRKLVKNIFFLKTLWRGRLSNFCIIAPLHATQWKALSLYRLCKFRINLLCK